MKKYIYIVLIFLGGIIQAQNITLSIANVQITNDGSNDYYEADIMIASDSDYVQGSGQFFLDYNTAAFGSSIQTLGAITFERPMSSILGSQSLAVDNYNSFVVNDNTGSKVSFLWQQFWSEGTIGANNVTNTPTVLVHLKIRYIDSGQTTNICFDTTSNPAFDDQFFTACGPGTGPAAADCGGSLGTQIMNYTPDCTNAEPVPLSVSELAEESRVVIYPNPVNDVFRIKGIKEKVLVQIYDVNGRLILKALFDENEAIDVSHLTSGVYFVETIHKDIKQLTKLLKS